MQEEIKTEVKENENYLRSITESLKYLNQQFRVHNDLLKGIKEEIKGAKG